MIRHLSLILLITCGISWAAYGQDPIFSQFYASPLQLNPAFAGNTVGPTVHLNYRNQWPSWQRAYTTYAASYSQFFRPVNSGFGLMLLSDDAADGLLKTNKIAGFYSYRLQINREWRLKLGVEAAYVQTRLDWDRLVFLDQLDPLEGLSPGGTPIPSAEVRPESLNNGYFDVSTGLLVYSSRFYGGVTIKHLNTPNESILGINENSTSTSLPVRYSVHAGMELPLNIGPRWSRNSFFSPSIMYVRQEPFAQINGGGMLRVGSIFGGLWYRHSIGNADAFIFLVGVQQGALKIGYSFDLPQSISLSNTGGTHEISLTMTFGDEDRIDYNDCLNLFR